MTDGPSLFSSAVGGEPLASRLRPNKLDGFVGQAHIVGDGTPLRDAITSGNVSNMILWGPPGSGKTTLARIVAAYTDRHFEPFSAVTDGVPRVREILRAAKNRRHAEGRGTILFCDEIHRFNKAQQDAFLPSVEEGLITLIGATTENPSFSLNNALLSRVPVFTLTPHDAPSLERLIEDGCALLNRTDVIDRLEVEATQALIRFADGDARRVLNAVEAMCIHIGVGPADEPITLHVVNTLLATSLPRYDRDGDQHYDLISALHKSVRGSSVEGSLYWFARMIQGGEDPLYIARRLVRMASEDIGLADPRALSVALAAKDAYQFLGTPEGHLALAEAVVYLATAPKSTRVYEAWKAASTAAEQFGSAEVPLHIRNAPTKLMKELGHGEGYRYDPAEGGFAAGQTYLPEGVQLESAYVPLPIGYEKTLMDRLRWWRERADADAG